MFSSKIQKLSKAIIAVCMLVSLNAQAETTSGELEITNKESSKQLALLLNTEIDGNVNGLIASIKVKQTFQNNTGDWVNGRYVFPLPQNAAVDSFKVRIGDRVINGLIKEKQEAKRVFQAAKRSGKKASLLEQHRPNLFSISVANIGPHENVITELTFIDQVKFEDNTFSLRLPTTITPRYIPNALIKSSNAEVEESLTELINAKLSEESNDQNNTISGWATNNNRVTDASSITPPQTHSTGSQTSHHFTLSLSVNAGLPLQSITSNTHKIQSNTFGNNDVMVSLSNGHEKMDSDVVLTWQATIGNSPKAAFFQQKFDNAYYSMLMIAPPALNTSLSLPRDVTFVVDTSGSMSGQSMEQAKEAMHKGLDYLSPNDKFNIIQFNSSHSALFEQNQNVTASSLSQAHSMIDSLSAGGGTEMLEPLEEAFNQITDSAYLKQVIFITDGSIGSESELFTMIKHNVKNARLFMVGIGSAPNTFFMEKAAKFGRGTYTMIDKLNNVNEKMTSLFEKITSPIMRDINVDWSTAEKVEQYPQKVSDLYAGQPLTLVVKSTKPIDQVSVSGKLLNSPWEKSLNLSNNSTTKTDNLDAVWARQKVASLMDQLRSSESTLDKIKPEVIKLGITHSIVTKYTSFIAVEQKPSKPTSLVAKQKSVPNLMPKGSTMPAPQTATPATLLSLLGGLMILLANFMQFFKRKKANRVISPLSRFSQQA